MFKLGLSETRTLAPRFELWICDVQEIFSGKLLNEDYFFFLVKTLAEFAQITGMKIKVTEQYPERLGPTHPALKAVLSHVEVEYLAKTKFSMVTDEGRNDPVANPTYIVLCGIEAHICIYQTAMELKAKGYTPVIIVDAVTSQRRFQRNEAFKAFYADPHILTMTFESFVYAFMEDKNHHKFREILGLVKKVSLEYPTGGDEY